MNGKSSFRWDSRKRGKPTDCVARSCGTGHEDNQQSGASRGRLMAVCASDTCLMTLPIYSIVPILQLLFIFCDDVEISSSDRTLHLPDQDTSEMSWACAWKKIHLGFRLETFAQFVLCCGDSLKSCLGGRLLGAVLWVVLSTIARCGRCLQEKRYVT